VRSFRQRQDMCVDTNRIVWIEKYGFDKFCSLLRPKTTSGTVTSVTLELWWMLGVAITSGQAQV
jgi:hypothetical protein